jgi:hypothetical protein
MLLKLVCLFSLIVSCAWPQAIADGTYTVANFGGTLTWDDPYSTNTVGTYVWLWPPNATAAQQWTFTSVGNGYYTVKNGASGLLLDDPYSGTTSGLRIWQYPANGTNAQKWLVTSVGNGFYTVKNLASGLVIDAAGNTQQTYIVQKPSSGSASQHWQIRKNGVSLTPSSLTFPRETLDSTSTAQKATLSNTSNSVLAISSIGISGTNPGDFGYSTLCGTNLAVSASCAMNVTFSPKATGTRTATLQVFDNAQGSPQTVALSGTGTAVGTHTVSLNWTLSTTPGVTLQKIYRCTGSGCTPGTLVGTVGASATSLTDMNVANGTTYVYAATAVDSSGESLMSNTVTTTVPL